MADTASVKRVLARLARRSTGAATHTATRLSRDRSPDYRTVIDRASAATQDLTVAVEFAESVGVEELETAVDEAAATGDHAAVRRGRRALSAFRRVRSAATSD